MNILAIDTTEDTTQIFVEKEEKIYIKKKETKGKYAKYITPMIKELLEELGLSVKNLDLIIAVAGPGSWNGIRIGVVTAKLLAYSLDIPVVGIKKTDKVSPSQIITAGKQRYKQNPKGDGLGLSPIYPENYKDTLKEYARK